MEQQGNHAGSRNRPTRRDMFFVGFEFLRIVEGFNVRYDYGDLEELANSIAENGVKVPLRGYKDKDLYYITDGHRRYRALKLLQERGIEVNAPFVVETKDYNDEKRTLDLLLTNDGKKLTLLEEADVYTRLHNFGWSQSEIARKTGKSLTHISNCFLLMSASTKLLRMIREGKVSATVVIDNLKEVSSKELEDSIDEAIADTGKDKVTRKHLTKSYREINIKVLETLYNKLEDIESDENNDVILDVKKLNAVWELIKHLKGQTTFEEFLEKFKK